MAHQSAASSRLEALLNRRHMTRFPGVWTKRLSIVNVYLRIIGLCHKFNQILDYIYIKRLILP
jgi:hypothetical protein